MAGDEEPRRADGKVSTRPVELVAVQGRPFERIDYDGDGRQSARTALPMAIGGTYGPTVSSSGGWSAVSVFLGPGLEQRLPAYQGVYAVQGDATPRPRLLTAPLEDTTSKAGLRPLGWGPQDTLVLLSLSSEGARVLAWDVVGGAVTRVGRLVGTPPPGDDTKVGEALPMLAL